jgi:hypothetical protein
MANVSVFQFSWVSMEGSEMYPGAVHYWSVYPLGYTDVWTVTCAPVAGGPNPPQLLSVTDVTIAANADGSRSFLFSVENVGASYIDGYGINVSVISP